MKPDTEIREEWNIFIKDVREYGDFHETLASHVENFWLSILHSQREKWLEEEIKHLEGKKIPVIVVSVSNLEDVTDITYIGVSQKDWDGYNKAIDEILSHLTTELEGIRSKK